SGKKSTTGKPLLANDPHLALQIPSIWYENHLHSPNFQVTGVTFPGVPGVIIGYNSSIAWGLTNAFPDVQDLYIEKVPENNPDYYLENNSPQKFEKIVEIIDVKGEQPHEEEVLLTSRGPLISKWLPDAKRSLSMQWTALEPGILMKSIIDLNRASNWEEFKEALKFFSVPAQNFVYADTAGNIGYVMAGKVPLRKKGKGLLPVPAWTGEYGWVGYIPFERLPRSFNPPEGYIVTANNKVTGNEYPYFISTSWMSGYRAFRITELLRSREKFSISDFKKFQGDLFSHPAREMREHLLKIEPKTPLEERILKKMDNWDLNLTPESPEAAVFEVFQYKMAENTFSDEMQELTPFFIGKGITAVNPTNSFIGRSFQVLRKLMKDEQNHWFDIKDTPKREDLHRIMRRSFDQTITFLKQNMGKNPDLWEWGKIHRIIFVHPLGLVKPMNYIFNKGPFPLGGDTNTIFQAAYAPGEPYDAKAFVASYRQIIDLSDLDNSISINTTGQSGLVGSTHYDDMIDSWLNMKYHPMIMNSEVIRKISSFKLNLIPVEN
ncbi:MAG: penicillin acylase family protein, partial [Fidelibacterota bacterium]